MALKDDLAKLIRAPVDQKAALTTIALMPVLRTERIRLLRQWETESQRPFDPRDFARAVDGIPPS